MNKSENRKENAELVSSTYVFKGEYVTRKTEFVRTLKNSEYRLYIMGSEYEADISKALVIAISGDLGTSLCFNIASEDLSSVVGIVRDNCTRMGEHCEKFHIDELIINLDKLEVAKVYDKGILRKLHIIKNDTWVEFSVDGNKVVMTEMPGEHLSQIKADLKGSIRGARDTVNGSEKWSQVGLQLKSQMGTVSASDESNLTNMFINQK